LPHAALPPDGEQGEGKITFLLALQVQNQDEHQSSKPNGNKSLFGLRRKFQRTNFMLTFGL
jgi:hypothetical protein